MFLPMSCTSPLTVATTILPFEAAPVRLLLLDERDQVGDRLLHHARRFDDLRQEHLARAEEVADDVHAVHQRAFDHRQRRLAGGGGARAFLGIGDDEVGDALHQGVRQALLDRQRAPRQVRAGVLRLAFLDRLREFHGGASPAPGGGSARRPPPSRAAPARDRRRRRAAGVDDAHRQPGLDRVVEEDGVDRLAPGSLPRNENETLETPPEICACGRWARIQRRPR